MEQKELDALVNDFQWSDEDTFDPLSESKDLKSDDLWNDVLDTYEQSFDLCWQQSYRRLKILNVQSDIQSKILECEEMNACKHILTVLLKDEWIYTPVEKDDIIHVIGRFDGNTCIINTDNNLLILHPDNLISATLLSDSFKCLRKSILSLNYRIVGSNNEFMLYGSLIHSLLQQSVVKFEYGKDLVNEKWLESVSEELVNGRGEEIMGLGKEESEVMTALKDYYKLIIEFCQTYLRPEPVVNSLIKDEHGKPSKLAITKLLNVEENIWDPIYGLKGKIDLTCHIQMKTDEKQNKENKQKSKSQLIPFELKTGSSTNTLSHRTQIVLYTFMLSQKYKNCESGVLFYIKRGEMKYIKLVERELKNILQNRNLIAKHMNTNNRPEMINDSYTCSQCFMKEACFMEYVANQENLDIEKEKQDLGPIWEIYHQQISNLSKEEILFWKEWMSAIEEEEKVYSENRKEIWQSSLIEREMNDKCLSGLHLNSLKPVMDPSSQFPYLYRFSKENSSYDVLNVGDSVVVSKGKEWAIRIGYVREITQSGVLVGCDQPIDQRKIYGKNILDFEKIENGNYRLDLDVLQSNLSVLRGNILQLYKTPTGQTLRDYLMKHQEPQFIDWQTTYLKKDQEIISDYLSKSELNHVQKEALVKVLDTQSFCIWHGIPGCGKSHAISHLVALLNQLGKKVLVVAYTNHAVDHLVQKIKQEGVDVFRLSRSRKSMSVKELKEVNCRVFATTCLRIQHPLLNEFDFCIVEEAGQVLLPICFAPLLLSRKFLLVGDDLQLPPLSKSDHQVLRKSLFGILKEKYDHAVVRMSLQYRMCDVLTQLCNDLIYGGMIQCANETVAKQRLEITVESKGWLGQVLNPQQPLMFLNTEQVKSCHEKREGEMIINLGEVELILLMVQTLIKLGLKEEEIGLISVYKSQCQLINQKMKHVGLSVECLTVDQYQGMDKEVVLISFVRSNQHGRCGTLLKDEKRINVALSRAKKKLIMVGNMQTLQTCLIFQKLKTILKDEQVYKLIDANYEESIIMGDEKEDIENLEHGRKRVKVYKREVEGVMKSFPILGEMLEYE